MWNVLDLKTAAQLKSANVQFQTLRQQTWSATNENLTLVEFNDTTHVFNTWRFPDQDKEAHQSQGTVRELHEQNRDEGSNPLPNQFACLLKEQVLFLLNPQQVQSKIRIHQICTHKSTKLAILNSVVLKSIFFFRKRLQVYDRLHGVFFEKLLPCCSRFCTSKDESVISDMILFGVLKANGQQWTKWSYLASQLFNRHCVHLFYVISKDSRNYYPKIGALANLISSPCNRST